MVFNVYGGGALLNSLTWRVSVFGAILSLFLIFGLFFFLFIFFHFFCPFFSLVQSLNSIFQSFFLFFSVIFPQCFLNSIFQSFFNFFSVLFFPQWRSLVKFFLSLYNSLDYSNTTSTTLFPLSFFLLFPSMLFLRFMVEKPS